MENPQLGGDWWGDLGMKYEAAFGHDVVLRQVTQRFVDMLPPDANVLECGSGTGKPIAETVAKSGRHIHGIDYSAEMVALCQKQVSSGTFEVANMLEFEPKVQYDGIVASLSLFELSPKEHASMTEKWYMWLKPGGFLFINTMRAEDCPKQVKKEMYDADGECASGVKWSIMGDISVITLLTRRGWGRLLAKAGFEISYTQDDLFVPAAEGCDDEPRYYIIAQKPHDK